MSSMYGQDPNCWEPVAPAYEERCKETTMTYISEPDSWTYPPEDLTGYNPNPAWLSDTTYKGTVYLSGPISGETYEDARYGWRQEAIQGFKRGITALSPMRHEGHLAEIKGPLKEQYPDHYFSGSKIIFEKDRLDIERSDIVLVNLLGAKRASLGTVAEIGMASVMGKQIVLVMERDGNIHEHPFVTVPASLRLDNLADAIDAINSLLSEGL